MKKIYLLMILIVTVVFVQVTVYDFRLVDSHKVEANRYCTCDITAAVNRPDGITILDTEDANLTIPDKTELHIFRINRNGYIDVDYVDVTISDEVMEHYSENPVNQVVQAANPDLKPDGSLIFMQKIRVEDVDSKEVTKLYNRMCYLNDHFDTNHIIVTIIACLIYLCPTAVIAARAVKKGRYGVLTFLLPVVFLILSKGIGMCMMA